MSPRGNNLRVTLRKFSAFFLFLFASHLACAKAPLVFSTAADAAIQEISEQVLREAYHNIGYSIRVEQHPNARSLIMSNSGKFDGELSRIAGIDKEFPNLIPVPVAINVNEGVAFTKNKDMTISDWESLRPYRLACVLGVQVIRLALIERNIDCYYVATHEQTLQMLDLGRVDIALIPKINGLCVLRRSKLSGITISGEPLKTENLYHFLHKKNTELIPMIREELLKMELSGRIIEIRKAYIKAHHY